jgi:opacity protein-like surface antigen
MKQVWLATAAVAAIVVSQQAHADGMYVSIFGGADFQADESDRLGTVPFIDYDSDSDTGFALGGAIGAGLDNWAKGLRAELEVSYRRRGLGFDFITSGTHSHTGVVEANQSSFAIMANAWYDIDMGWKVTPYVGGGIGWARSQFEAHVSNSNFTQTTDDVNSGFAWQLGVGLNYQVDAGVDVGLGYRYVDSPENTVAFCGYHTCFGNIKPDNQSHSVMVNLTIETN